MKKIKLLFNQAAILTTIAATIFWSMNLSLLIPALPADAAAIVPSTIGLMNGNFSGAPIKASSNPTAIVKLSIKASTGGKFLQSVAVNFSGTGTFATTTLADIAANGSSGVALYNDSSGNLGSVVATSTGWIANTGNIILTPQPVISLGTGTTTYYVVIRTSSTAANGDQIIAAIPANGVITDDSAGGSGPANPFTANSFRVDAVAPAITSVTGRAGSDQLTIKFSEPVQQTGGGNLTAAAFKFTDADATVQATSSLSHSAGNDTAIMTMSGTPNGNLDATDFGNGTATSTMAANTGAIADMAGNVMLNTAVKLTSPVVITTATIPATYSGATYTSGSPLVSFAASGGSNSYIWATSTPADDAALQHLGLTVNSAGALFATSSVSNVTGNYLISFRATDASNQSASTTKFFQINVAAASGGAIPAISSINPGGSAQNSLLNLTINGSYTNFSGLSTVVFSLPAGTAGDNGITVGTTTALSLTSLTVPLTVASGAAAGSRDVKITTGSQVVFMPGGFNIFAAAGNSGLNLNFPPDGAGNVSISPPPNFNFNPSATGGVNSYRITVKPNSDFSGTALWDYVFPSYALTSSSHCDASACNVGYGAGQFMVLAQPASLTPNTTYYWNVRTYSQMPNNVNDSAMPLDSAIARGFTTSGSITDSTPPTIQHQPIFSATVGAALNVFARVMDNIATASTTPALSSKLIYCTSAGCTPNNEVTGSTVGIGNGYFKYTIPAGSMGGALVRYWLSASDGANTAWFKGPGDVPFQLATIGAGASTITGAVTDGTNPIYGATIFAQGTGYFTTTAGNGTYTISNLPQGNYDLVAVKNGYADRSMQGIAAGSTGINFSLPAGGGGGFGGDTTKPSIQFTGPPQMNGNAPGADTNFIVFVGFSKPMSQTSVTTAGNMYIKDLNPATGVATDITTAKGGWTYYAISPGFPIPSGNNLAVWRFSPGQTFGDNKTILVIVTPNVTDTAGNSIQGNQPDGSWSYSFTTGMMANFNGFMPGPGGTGGTFQGGGTFGSGAFTPPYVTGAIPAPGTFDVPVNQKIVINFSEAMADDSGTYALKNYIVPYTLTGANPPYQSATVAASGYSVSLDSSKKFATVTITGNMSVSTRYQVKVLGGAKSASGMTLSPPGMETNQMFMTEFKTSSSASGDTAAPAITGIYPGSGASSVSVSTGAVNVGFNKDMDASAMNTSNFYLSIGSTAVNGTVEYRPAERQAYFMPKNSLNATTTYTINLTASVLALNGQALSATTTTFTTGGPDTTLPAVSFINADDYSIAITYSKPMNAATAVDALNFASSTLKASLYTIKQGAAGNAQNGTTLILEASASLSYDAITNTVIIKGIPLTVGNEVYVAVGAVKDAAGNVMVGGNTAKATVQSSANTKGALGPMAMSTDAFSMGGGFMPTNFSGGNFGFAPPVEARPFSMMTNQTTTYHISLPISRQITAGGTVVLTFPTGFDISGAKQDINSPMRSDLNGPGPGVIKFKCNSSVTNGKTCSGDSTITGDTAADASTVGGLADDGVTVNATARAVTITISADTGSEGHDFLNFDIAGIKNSAVPKDFNTTGYTVDIKTKNGTTLMESLTSQPFFIQAGGNYSISGTITATGAGTIASTTKVYLMSPMTGPMDTTSSGFSTDAASYSFSGLSSGEYFLSTDPSISLGSADFVGKQMPERVSVAGADKTYNISLDSANVGTAVTISVKGPANEPIDVFASSPTGFRVKSVTLDGNPNNYENITLNLADGNWTACVGPQMPKGPMMAGPPPMPSYLPPQPVNIIVQSGGSPTVVENSDMANDGILKFTLTAASKHIKGTVQDGAGKVMANAEVYAYSPQGGMGTHGQTAADGTFSLAVNDGSYIVGSFVPGMPPSKEVPVIVSSADSAFLFIDGAAAGITEADAQTAFILKVAKPDYTISGKVTDDTNVVQGASVYGYRTDGPGNAPPTNTDSAGNYTLYVSKGTWKVGVFLPQYGNLTEQTVTISGVSASNQNFAPSSTGTFKTVSGTVTVGGANKQGAFVRINGNSTSNEAITGADGKYSLKVPTGNSYVIKLFIPGMGEVSTTAAFDVADDTTKNFTIGAANTITVLTTASVSKAFIDLTDVNGVGGHAEISNATSTSLSLPNGSYKVSANIPGVVLPLTAIAGTSGATAYATSTGVGVITVDGNESLTITIPALRTVSGTVNISDAWVDIVNPANGIHLGTKTSTTTPSTFNLQVTDSTADYIINAMKPGYYRDATTLTVNGSNPASQTLTLASSTLNISGQVKIGSSGAALAFVRAEKLGGGFSGCQADANGNYSLAVTAGTWKVYAVADGYAETYIGNPIVIGAAPSAGNNITLSSTVALNPPKSKSITPASGGTLEDPAAGIKITMPANALKNQDTSAGNIQDKETNNIQSTATAKPVDGKAVEVKATDSSSNLLTNLSGSIYVDMSYTPAELANTPSADGSPVNTKSKVEKLQTAYWDDTAKTWVTLPKSITYLKSDGTILDSSDAAHTPAEDLSNVATTTFTIATTHLSQYAPISSPEGAPASAPAGLSATTQGKTQIDLSWTAVSGATSYDLYRNTVDSGNFPRVGSEPTTTGTSYSDTGLTAGTTYYYKVGAINASGESIASASISAATQSGGGAVINLPTSSGSPAASTPSTPSTPPASANPSTTAQTPNATAQTANNPAAGKSETSDLIKADAKVITENLGVKRDFKAETAVQKQFIKPLLANLKKIDAKKQSALNYFISYGTASTVKFSKSERAEVLASYKSAFNKLPATDKQWLDIIKIASNQAPQERNKATESNSAKAFKKIYKRLPNLKNAADNQAVMAIAYGLMPAQKDLKLETAASKKFKSIYGYAPKSLTAMNIVRAIAYSGVNK